MDQFLKGKTAAVTGGTRGIGLAIAEHLLRAGAHVAICGRSQEGVDRAVKHLSESIGGNVSGETADISQSDDVKRFFEILGARFGGLDILVNNAGVGVFKNLKDLSPEEWHRTVDLNLHGVYYCCHHGVPLLRRKGGGYIIQISSLAGKNAFAGGTAYNASKFGLNGFSEALMQDLRYDDIRVTYIMPGSVDTEFNSGSGGSDWKIAPEDIGQVVLDLLRMPARTLISRVEMRPSKPKKNAQ